MHLCKKEWSLNLTYLNWNAYKLEKNYYLSLMHDICIWVSFKFLLSIGCLCKDHGDDQIICSECVHDKEIHPSFFSCILFWFPRYHFLAVLESALNQDPRHRKSSRQAWERSSCISSEWSFVSFKRSYLKRSWLITLELETKVSVAIIWDTIRLFANVSKLNGPWLE